jgi:hypothetical protein
MKNRNSSSRLAATLAALILTLAVTAPRASACTIWTDWTSATVGVPGAAIGTLDGVTLRYVGEVLGAIVDGTSGIWSPDSSFIGGTSTTSPSTVGDDIRLQGTPGTNTLTFDSPLTDPVFAIWSLGQPFLAASFTFDATPIFQAGGPNSGFGGGPIIVAGNVVTGAEGNGVVMFPGTFTSISWTNTPEFFYAFTVGIADDGATAVVPEPTSLLLVGTGVAGLIATARRRRKQR